MSLFLADVAATFENLVAPPPDRSITLLKSQKECPGFTAHAWIHDRCRECGGAENAHSIKNIDSALGAGKLSRANSIDRVRMNVREPSTLQKIGSGGPEYRSRSNSMETKPIGLRSTSGLSKLDVQGNGGSDESSAYPLKSPVQAQAEDAETHMRNVVAKMKFFEDEKHRLAAENTERLTNKQITQHEHEANVAALQAAFDKKEQQMKLEAEQARRDLEAANELRAKEIQEAAQRQIYEAQEEARRQVELAQAETRALLEQAEREKAEALAFKREAEEARAAAQAEALAAHASKDESERKREEMEAQLRAAQAAKLAAEADEEQPSMPSSVEGSTLVAHDGDVHLSDALRSVQKLTQTGSNVVRYTGNKPATFCSIFIRELDQNAPSTPAEPVAASAGDTPAPRTAQYSLCWCKADERMVHPTRALAFSEISAVVLGKQSTVLRTKAVDAQDSHCVSFIAGPKSLRPSLHLQFGTARAAETWAFGIASLCKELGIKPSVFEAGQYFEQEAENKKDHDLAVRPECVEKDDGSLPPTAKDWDSLNNAKQPLRYSIDLAVKCANLPSVHKNTIVCLVDRNERTNKLMYVGQSDRVTDTNSPEFKKGFPLTFVDNSAKSLRFNVYDVPAGSKNIEDDFRLGSAIVSIASLVDKAGSEFVFALHHKNPQKQAALLANRATISISCAQRKLLLTPEQSLKESLKASEKELVRGDTFTNYLEGMGAQNVTAYYTPGHPPIAALRLTPEEMADRFDIGSIHWATVGAKVSTIETLTDHSEGDRNVVCTRLLTVFCSLFLAAPHCRLKFFLFAQWWMCSWARSILCSLTRFAMSMRSAS